MTQSGLSAEGIHGYDQDEFTHMAVAVNVLSGRADTGMAIYSSARALDLDFIPVAEERYDLIIPEACWEDFKIQQLLDIIGSASFRQMVEAMGGDDARETGSYGRWDGERGRTGGSPSCANPEDRSIRPFRIRWGMAILPLGAWGPRQSAAIPSHLSMWTGMKGPQWV